MIKRNLLLSLIIVQGALIVIGIIVIIYVIFTRLQSIEKKEIFMPDNIKNNDFFLLDKNHIQIKKIENGKIIFEIYELSSSNKIETIVINEN